MIPKRDFLLVKIYWPIMVENHFENCPKKNEKCFSDIFVRAFADGRDINGFNNSIVILIASLQELSQHWSRFFDFQNHSLEKI